MTHSDREGRFSVTGLERGQQYTAYAEKTGYAPEHQRIVDDILVRGGDEHVQLVLLESCEFVIRIVDGPTAELIPFASVLVSPADGVSTFAYFTALDPANTGSQLSLKPGECRIRLRRDLGVEAPERAEVFVSVNAMGHTALQTQIEVDWAQPAAVTLRLERLARDNPLPVRFRAEFRAGRPFTGPLLLFLRRQQDESPVYFPSVVRLEFKGGLSSQAIPLSSGMYWVYPQGTGTAGAWWRPRQAFIELHVPRRATGDHVVTIPIEGGALEVTVLDAQGRKRRSYGLEIAYSDGTGPGPIAGWDFPGYSDAGVGEQVAFVRPMPGTVRAWIPGVGSGKAPFPRLDDGERVEVMIRLTQRAPASTGSRSGGK